MTANPADVFRLSRPALEAEADHMLQNVYWSDFEDEEVAIFVALLRPTYLRGNPPGSSKPDLQVVRRAPSAP